MKGVASRRSAERDLVRSRREPAAAVVLEWLALSCCLLLLSCSSLPATMEEAVQCFRGGDYDSCRRYFESARDLEPSNWNALLYLARCEHLNNNYDAAASQYDALYSQTQLSESAKGMSFVCGFWAADCHSMKGHYGKALRIYRDLAQRFPHPSRQCFIPDIIESIEANLALGGGKRTRIRMAIAEERKRNYCMPVCISNVLSHLGHPRSAVEIAATAGLRGDAVPALSAYVLALSKIPETSTRVFVASEALLGVLERGHPVILLTRVLMDGRYYSHARVVVGFDAVREVFLLRDTDNLSCAEVIPFEKAFGCRVLSVDHRNGTELPPVSSDDCECFDRAEAIGEAMERNDATVSPAKGLAEAVARLEGAARNGDEDALLLQGQIAVLFLNRAERVAECPPDSMAVVDGVIRDLEASDPTWRDDQRYGLLSMIRFNRGEWNAARGRAQAGDYRASIGHADKALSCNPLYGDCWTTKAYALARLAYLVESVDEGRSLMASANGVTAAALRCFPDSREFALARIRILAMQGAFLLERGIENGFMDEAVADARKELAKGDSLDVWLVLAHAYLNRAVLKKGAGADGKSDLLLSIEACSRAMITGGATSELFYLRGFARLENEEADLAARDLRDSLILDRGNTKARDLLQKMQKEKVSNGERR